VTFGTPRCFVVRAVVSVGPVSHESAPAGPACATPVDTFPPPAPANLQAFPDSGRITLTWNPVSASDLAGYIVLRAEGTGEKLQPQSGTVTATTFTDTHVTPGVTYVYAVVAVDTAPAHNPSPQSNRQTVTARDPIGRTDDAGASRR
jgi:fibronectin type 3 domain-containing protein